MPIMASAALGAVEVTVGRMSAMDLFRLLRNCEEELLDCSAASETAG